MSGAAAYRYHPPVPPYPQPNSSGGGSAASALFWTSVANFAALTALAIPSAGANSNGLRVWVLSVKDYFHLDMNTTVATTPSTILATSLGGNTRWIREELPHPAWQQQVAWGINAGTGNDENIGSVASPLATWAEFMRRYGQGSVVAASTTITIASNLPATDPIAGHLIVASNVFFQILGGVASQPQVGTLTGITALNRGANAAWIIVDAGENFTPEVTLRIRNTTVGARLNAISWVALVDPASGGNLDTVRVSLPALMPTLTSGAVAATASSWVNGDTYAVEQLFTARLGDLWIEPQRGDVTAALPTLVVSELDLSGGFAGVMPQTNGVQSQWYSCRFASQVELNSTNMFFVNCITAAGLVIQGGTFAANTGLAINPAAPATAPAIVIEGGANVTLGNDFLSQGAVMNNQGLLLFSSLGIFNSVIDAAQNALGAGLGIGVGARGGPGAATGAAPGTYALYGAGNTVGVWVGSGCQLRYNTLANLTISGVAAAAVKLGINAATVDVLDPAGAFVNLATTWAALGGHDAGNVVNGHNLASIVAAV